jgi:hypothetical protein
MTIEISAKSGRVGDLFVLEQEYFTELYTSITPARELNIICGFNLAVFAKDKSLYPEVVEIDSFWEENKGSYIKDFYVELYNKRGSIIANMSPLYEKDGHVFYSSQIRLTDIKLKKDITCKAKITFIDPTVNYVKSLLTANPSRQEIELYRNLHNKQKILNLNSKFRLSEVEHTYQAIKSITHKEVLHSVIGETIEISNTSMLERISYEEEKFGDSMESVILSPKAFLFGNRRVDNLLDNHNLQKEVIIREFLNSEVIQYSLGTYSTDVSGLTLGKTKEIVEDGNSGRSSITRSALPSAMNSGAQREFGSSVKTTSLPMHNIQLYDAVTKSVTSIEESVLNMSKEDTAPIQVKFYKETDSLLSDMNTFSTIWNNSKELYIIYYITEVKSSGEIVWEILTKEDLLGSNEPFLCKILKYNSQKYGVLPLKGLNYTTTNEFFIIR